MHQCIFTVGEILDQPVAVPHPVERLPAIDILALRSIVDYVQGLLQIGIAAPQRKGIEIEPENYVDIIGDLCGEIGCIGLGPLHPVLVKVKGLKFHIPEGKRFILEIDERTLIGSVVNRAARLDRKRRLKGIVVSARGNIDQEITEDLFTTLEGFVGPLPVVDKIRKRSLQGLELLMIYRRREPVGYDGDVRLQFLGMKTGNQARHQDDPYKTGFTHTIYLL